MIIVLITIILSFVLRVFFLFKQKTAYEMRMSDWSSDVCSSDLIISCAPDVRGKNISSTMISKDIVVKFHTDDFESTFNVSRKCRSEEHTSELQSLMRISYAVFCLKKKEYHTKQA